MDQHSIHASRYGMAVPMDTRRSFSLQRATSLRWTEISDALRRVVDGVRVSHDPVAPLLDIPSAVRANSQAGREHERPAECLNPR